MKRQLDFSLLIIFFTLSLIGATLLPFIPVQLKPGSIEPSLSVSFNWPNASAQAVEQEVTSNLEGALNTIRGVTNIRSESQTGRGSITLSFMKDVNMDIARFEAAAVIRNQYPSLPEGVSYPVVNQGGQNASDGSVLVYVLLSPANVSSISQVIEEKITERLNALEGVEKTEVYGIYPFRWRVEYDARKMESAGITDAALKNAIGNVRLRYSIGRVRVNEQERGLIIESPYNGSPDWNNLPVANVDGKCVKLGELASIRLEQTEPSSYYRVNGLNTNILAIYARQGVNQLSLVKKLKKEAKAIEASLPEGLSLTLTSDPTEFIRTEIYNISWRTGLTLLILLIFVFAVSRSWKYLSIIVISLLANLFIAFMFYYILDIELHLYSIAGITISFGLLIDNSIIMIDHYRLKGNRRVFLAILASTLTTIAALSVVFFLSENLQNNLVDFVKIVIVNLFVSLFIALFFIPSLMEQMRFSKAPGLKARRIRAKKRIVKFSGVYGRAIIFLLRFKPVVFIIAVLGFGLPVFLLPTHLDKKSMWPEIYNATFGSAFYNETLKKPVDKILGGSLRLFLEKVDGRNYFTEKSQTILYVNVYMPDGAVISQMNDVVIRLEGYLQQFSEVKQFEARVQSSNYATISVTFKPEYEFSGFPYYLKDMLTSYAINLGSADCQVYGVGDGFSNVMREQAGSYKVRFLGYSYDELYEHARRLKDTLLLNPRINEVNITERDTWYRNNSEQFVLAADQEKLVLNNNYLSGLYSGLKSLSAKDVNAGAVMNDGERRQVYLSSSYQSQFNRWNLDNDMIYSGNRPSRLSRIGEITKEKTAGSIIKRNQNYQLFLEYEFIGPNQLGHMHLDETMEKFTASLPMGYDAQQINRSFLNNQEKTEQNISLLIIILLVFFICSILFESLRQPMAILTIIPFTFIGLFLTYHFLDIGFNQGGYAAMILLSGLTVNSVIYIINEMNNLKKTWRGTKLKLYLKAFHTKIIPIILTILSTVLGLIPFLVDGILDKFWYALVTGTMGGLLFSVIGLYFYLPMFLMKRKDGTRGSGFRV